MYYAGLGAYYFLCHFGERLRIDNICWGTVITKGIDRVCRQASSGCS